MRGFPDKDFFRAGVSIHQIDDLFRNESIETQVRKIKKCQKKFMAALD
jgi:hypothetical protein